MEFAERHNPLAMVRQIRRSATWSEYADYRKSAPRGIAWTRSEVESRLIQVLVKPRGKEPPPGKRLGSRQYARDLHQRSLLYYTPQYAGGWPQIQASNGRCVQLFPPR